LAVLEPEAIAQPPGQEGGLGGAALNRIRIEEPHDLQRSHATVFTHDPAAQQAALGLNVAAEGQAAPQHSTQHQDNGYD
jgi:hypothetical protein